MPEMDGKAGAAPVAMMTLPDLIKLPSTATPAIDQAYPPFQVANAIIAGQQIDVFGLPQAGDKLVLLSYGGRPVIDMRRSRDACEAFGGIGLMN
jgi:hypothetical protein